MLCGFSRRFPSQIGRFLDASAGLGRSFREESITDVLMGALVALKPFGVAVHFPDEPKTGADMEWIFKRMDGSSHFRLLIQAKRLYGEGNIWRRRSYPEILHMVPSSRTMQSSILVNESRKTPHTFPLYMFYTHQSVCDLASISHNLVEGVSFVNGFFVDKLVRDYKSNALTAPRTTSLGVIQPKMFPISRVLCKETSARHSMQPMAFSSNIERLIGIIGNSTMPTPEDVHANLVELASDMGEIPPVGGELPESGDKQEGHASRYRVIFNSLPPEEYFEKY